MFFDKDKAYEAGTFILDQKVYHIYGKEHIFRFHVDCECCDNTGSVLIKGRKYKCPNCNGNLQTKKIIEKVVSDNPDKIKCVLSLKNNKESLEIYTTGSDGVGVIICKQNDCSNTYFGSKQEAQDICDKYNREHNVYNLIEKYVKLAVDSD